jgi:hypothetical protein
MKRFLILSISIVFVTVSCAGPSKVRWTKPDFHQDQFEKDREDCIQAVQDGLEQKLTVEECLAKKGYESEPQPPPDKEKSKTAEIAKNVGAVLLVVVFVAVGVVWLAAIATGH